MAPLECSRSLLLLARASRSTTTSRRNLCIRTYTSTAPKAARNRIYNPVRTEDEFETLNLLSSSSRTPLITFWTASWCSTCTSIKPLLHNLISPSPTGAGIGEAEGGVSFAEIQLDSPTIGNLMMKYQISSMPTLMAFDRGEAQLETRLVRAEQMKDRKFLENWIRTEAERQGRGGGGGTGAGLFGGLFGRS